MILREHEAGGVRSVATYSDCEVFRYALSREWGPGRRMLFVMLNPSTASELKNDPTVERCERRARALGYGSFRVANLFAFRATRPEDLKLAADPVGPDNAAALEDGAAWADMILCGWGVHGAHLGQGAAVAAALRATGKPLFSLGLTRDGHPRHPLYVGYGTRPAPWERAFPSDG